MSVLDLFRLDGRVAVVTGASSGLGVSFAQALAEAGADVVLGARRVDRLEETKALVESAGRRALAVETDVADPEACQRLVDAAMQEFGRVDVLVSNAAVPDVLRVAGGDPRREWDRTLATNLSAFFHLVKA
ncbi:MAG TPA: SDR family NAD(P)-dependent oxidoreductase, partial [Nocardioidaceae bacterium]|nr:SDR family NAD(P)-dependent oxidoreductase [Nocardioidaceae bacterium]